MNCSLGHRFCGDGILDERGSPQKEYCDDGNFATGDGCTPDCLFEAPISFTYDNQCTTGSLPAIQEDELLPMRRQGTTGGHFLANNASICDSAEQNGILPVSLKCNFDIYRGAPS
ncbi:MAG: hypothetical protein Q8O99_07375 [bacterium]|nr:hypothetical protein [bacterium]